MLIKYVVPKVLFFMAPLCSGCFAEKVDPEINISGIYWQASQIGSDCWAEIFSSQEGALFNEIAGLNFPFSCGVRGVCAFPFPFSSRGLRLGYTYFSTKATARVEGSPGSVHSAFMGNFFLQNPEGASLSGPSYERAEIEWDIEYHTLDIDWLQAVNFSFAQFYFSTGLRAAWIPQEITTAWFSPDNPKVSFSQGKEVVRNRFLGVGPSLGISSVWNIFTSTSFSTELRLDFSGAMLWGGVDIGDSYANDISQQIEILSRSFSSVGVYPMAGGFWGVRLGFPGVGYGCFYIDVGYEAQVWWEQLRFYSFTAGRLEGALMLQGGTFGIHCAF